MKKQKNSPINNIHLGNKKQIKKDKLDEEKIEKNSGIDNLRVEIGQSLKAFINERYGGKPYCSIVSGLLDVLNEKV